MNNHTDKKKDDRNDKIIGGAILIGIGLIFLLINFDIIPSLSDTWPLFIIVVGVALIVGSFRKKKKEPDQTTIQN